MLQEDKKDIGKLTEGGNDKGKKRGVRRKWYDGLINKGYVQKVQLVGNCNPIGSVNSVNICSFVSVFLFFIWDLSLFL